MTSAEPKAPPPVGKRLLLQFRGRGSFKGENEEIWHSIQTFNSAMDYGDIITHWLIIEPAKDV